MTEVEQLRSELIVAQAELRVAVNARWELQDELFDERARCRSLLNDLGATQMALAIALDCIEHETARCDCEKLRSLSNKDRAEKT